MGKSKERNDTTTQASESTFFAKGSSEASKMLEAALLQMDDIISGACADSNPAEGSFEWKNSIKEAARNLVTVIKNAPNPLPLPDAVTEDILLQWMQPACLLDYAKMLALQGSMPNICALSADMPNICSTSACVRSSPSLCVTPCSRHSLVSSRLARQTTQEHAANIVHYPCICNHAQQSLIFTNERGMHADSRTNSTASLPVSLTGRYGGSLDKRRRKPRSRADRGQRAVSHNDLICRKMNKQHCTSSQHFHYESDVFRNNYHSKTEERLRKLESERGALHMEVSILSEQVDAQSSKIQELENLLQEKKDSLRQMEEALQKEILSRSTLETQKLELLTSLSEMQLKQASLEHENLALRNINPLSNSEKFSRHTGQYSSLPRPPTSKKGVAFGKVPNLVAGAHTTVPLAVKGVSARCLSAPILGSDRSLSKHVVSGLNVSLTTNTLVAITIN